MSRPVRLAGTADFRIADMQRAMIGVFGASLCGCITFAHTNRGDRLFFGEVEHSTLRHDR